MLAGVSKRIRNDRGNQEERTAVRGRLAAPAGRSFAGQQAGEQARQRISSTDPLPSERGRETGYRAAYNYQERNGSYKS